MSVVNLAYAEAYPTKTGGFRGVAKNYLTGEIAKGELRNSLEEARVDAKKFVFAWANGRNMGTGSYRSLKGQWRMNYFIRADEVDLNEVKTKELHTDA
jgi:hypothetical protein